MRCSSKYAAFKTVVTFHYTGRFNYRAPYRKLIKEQAQTTGHFFCPQYRTTKTGQQHISEARTAKSMAFCVQRVFSPPKLVINVSALGENGCRAIFLFVFFGGKICFTSLASHLFHHVSFFSDTVCIVVESFLGFQTLSSFFWHKSTSVVKLSCSCLTSCGKTYHRRVEMSMILKGNNGNNNQPGCMSISLRTRVSISMNSQAHVKKITHSWLCPDPRYYVEATDYVLFPRQYIMTIIINITTITLTILPPHQGSWI